MEKCFRQKLYVVSTEKGGKINFWKKNNFSRSYKSRRHFLSGKYGIFY